MYIYIYVCVCVCVVIVPSFSVYIGKEISWRVRRKGRSITYYFVELVSIYSILYSH